MPLRAHRIAPIPVERDSGIRPRCRVASASARHGHPNDRLAAHRADELELATLVVLGPDRGTVMADRAQHEFVIALATRLIAAEPVEVGAEGQGLSHRAL